MRYSIDSFVLINFLLKNNSDEKWFYWKESLQWTQSHNDDLTAGLEIWDFTNLSKKNPTLKKNLLSIEQCNRYRCTLYLHSNVDSQSLRRSQNVMLLDAKIILHNSSISWLHPYLYVMVSFGLKKNEAWGIMLHKFNVLGFFWGGGVRPNKLFAELKSNNDYCIFRHILTNNNRMMQSSGASKALRTVVLLINWNNGSGTVILGKKNWVYFL